MAKGQMRSGREAKKPKKDKTVKVTAGTGMIANATPKKTPAPK